MTVQNWAFFPRFAISLACLGQARTPVFHRRDARNPALRRSDIRHTKSNDSKMSSDPQRDPSGGISDRGILMGVGSQRLRINAFRWRFGGQTSRRSAGAVEHGGPNRCLRRYIAHRATRIARLVSRVAHRPLPPPAFGFGDVINCVRTRRSASPLAAKQDAFCRHLSGGYIVDSVIFRHDRQKRTALETVYGTRTSRPRFPFPESKFASGSSFYPWIRNSDVQSLPNKYS